jgi:hypothetical protein
MFRFVIFALFVAAAPAMAEKCESARLDLPDMIADSVRPYVVCGIFSGRNSHISTEINGTSASGLDFSTCKNIRSQAVTNADIALRPEIPDSNDREEYIEDVLQQIDIFVSKLQSSDSIGIDPTEQTALCKTKETRTKNAKN